MVKVFGTAGIRGVFNRTQTPTQVYRFAETVAFVFGRGGYGIGWDGRKTSALLAKAITCAISATGSDMLVFGLIPTPVLAFATRRTGCLAGFSVTASHNPPEFSGVKVFGRNGMELSEFDEQRVERTLVVDPKKTSGQFGQILANPDVLDEYVAAIISKYQPTKKSFRIALDCATGPGGLVTPRVLKALGHEVVPVNAQVSWRFPARQPEPTLDNLADFCRMIPSLGVDFGFAHDGDGDRLVMVNSRGEIISDSICSIIALRGINKSTGSVILSENTSMAVEEEAERMGLRVLRARVGKTFALLETENGVFATEPSKITDPSWGLWEDGINAAVLIADTISRDQSLLQSLAYGSGWYYKQTNLSVGVDLSALLLRARETFRRFKIIDERVIDGCKLQFANGSWIMFRTSGTEPKTRIYCESRDPEELLVLSQEGVKIVEGLAYNPAKAN